MRTWVERFPGRLEYELDEFARRGLHFELDARLLEEQSRVVLRGALPHEGEVVALEVSYPDLFPYLRPEVVAPERRLERHQNPFAGNLCLLDRSTRAWSPSDTAAWLVAERVPYLLSRLAAGGDELRAAEAPQGEPVSAYFAGVAGAVVLLPEEALALPEDAVAGSGRIACSVAEPPRLRLRGMVAELVEKTPKGRTRTLARADADLLSRFGGRTVAFRWVRLDGVPEENSAAAIFAAIDSVRPGFGSPPWQPAADGQLAVAAAVIQEEVQQGTFADAWIFAVRGRLPGGRVSEYVVRSQRLTRHDLSARLPDAVRLGERTVALAGLGALGGELAIELAKAAVGELRGLDFDYVELGTIGRWPMGLSAVGHAKSDVLRARIALDYPFTRFEPFAHQLGGSASITTARSETELDVLDRFLDGADLLIDATAEIGVQQALAALAHERSLPQLYVSATEGARGGLIAHVRPGLTGCWLCLQWHLETGSIPLPAREEAATLQPRGCATLTFTGAGFDLLPVAAQAARVAAAALSDRSPQISGHGVFVCSFGDDRAEPPTWSSYPLAPHTSCPRCSESS